jgi:hypothetical protein
MFDLEREVAAWSAAVHAARCQPSASVTELSDHLYCEIDRARTAGVSDEEAFRIAVTRLGSPSELTAEHAKNRSALGTVCQLAAKIDRLESIPEYRRFLLGHSVIWAVLMITSALLLKKSAEPEMGAWMLIVIFIPLWLASDQILRAALRQKLSRGA